MKKPPFDLKAGQLWEGRYRKNSQPTQRSIVAVDELGVLWSKADRYEFNSTRNSTLANFEKWAERLLP
jgi:hypothetical protein